MLEGDIGPLASVGPGRVLWHIIESGVSVVRLTEVFRQAAHSPNKTASSNSFSWGLEYEPHHRDYYRKHWGDSN